MNQESVTQIIVGDRPISLSRPVLPHAARRLTSVVPQLNALNAACKSQSDAAAALGVSIGSVRTWIGLTGTTWINLKKRGPYNRKANA
jgi:hypothetical protein